MGVQEGDMLVFNQRVVHGQHRNAAKCDCWTFFVSLANLKDPLYTQGIPNTAYSHSILVATELGFFKERAWPESAVEHLITHPNVLQQYLYSHDVWAKDKHTPDDGHRPLIKAIRERGFLTASFSTYRSTVFCCVSNG